MRAALVLFLAACGCSSGADAPAAATDAGADAADVAVDAPSPSIRASRYCEVLVGFLSGSDIRIDVYNTFGLNDCPADAWAKVDPVTIKAERSADVVVLNGPRHWTLDAFEKSALLDETKVTFGGIEMRKAGEINLPAAEAMAGNKPYVARSVKRNTTVLFASGKPVYELVDPTGRTFTMQAWSDQKEAQTEASLAALGSKLVPPAGWSFRTRTLTADLRVTAIDGVATVVQDELLNTYQLSSDGR
ncbi:MAG: hypothetical protein HYV09_06815 [Deltaproteobacteria bacterium]|nr:hypothetical protein [Deltaproteobacteria bacterium]